MAFINDLSPSCHLSWVHITRLSLSGNRPLIYYLYVVRHFWFTKTVACHHWQTHRRTCAPPTHQSPAQVRLTVRVKPIRTRGSGWAGWTFCFGSRVGFGFTSWVQVVVMWEGWVRVVVLWQGLDSATSHYLVTANVYAIWIPYIAI